MLKKYFHSDYFKQSHVSLVNAKINESSDSLTVADIIKYCQRLESNMGVGAGSVTATKCQRGCLLISCVIPIRCTLHAYETTQANYLQFRQFHIRSIEIKPFPKINSLNISVNLDEITSGKPITTFMYRYMYLPDL